MLRLAVNLSIVVFSALASVAAITRAEAEQVVPSLSPDDAVVGYCAAWNTVDRTERERLLARVWAPDGVFHRAAEPTLAAGRAALSDTIAAFQRSHPGARFRCSAPQVLHGAMRFTWMLLRPDGVDLARGTDFSELAADGRIRRLYGFTGEPPAVKP